MNLMGKFQTDDDLLDLAAGAADKSLREPWHGLAPDEWAMAAEEGLTEDGWSMAGATGTLLAFLFAEGADEWGKVARRASALLRRYAVGRAARMDLSGFPYFTGWGLEEFVELVGEENKGMVGRIMGWFYPFDGPEGLRRGTERLYLFTLVIDPQLLRRLEDGHGAEQRWKVMNFVECERAFSGADGMLMQKAEANARSKWSARAGKVRAEFVKAGGCFAHGSFFGKSEAAREKYRAAAMGNRNRRGGGGRGHTD